MRLIKILGIAGLLLLSNINFLFSQRYMEKLDRALVAMRKSSNEVYLSWRMFATDPENISFNIYRDFKRLNAVPVKNSTNYIDNISDNHNYYIMPVIDGKEMPASKIVKVFDDIYASFPVRNIPGANDDEYEVNDASIGDLDGDGDYELVIKRLVVNNVIENTKYHYLEAYHLDGTFIWAINLGPNIYNKVEVNFLVYDLDNDGKAEVATRTSEGTIDGTGVEIPDLTGDKIINYRNSIAAFENQEGWRTKGPDFISIFEGAKGKEIARNNYIARDPISQWGGTSGAPQAHRATKCMWAVVYLDGVNPSFVIGRGIYEKIVLEAWNFRDNKLTKIWNFNTDNWPGYDKQGNHNLTTGDVDQDGRDEIVYGGMCVDDDGTGLYTTGLGHGDAIHMSDFDPDRPGLEVWDCHESYPLAAGSEFRDAKTGGLIWGLPSTGDVGRALALNMDPNVRGAECFTFGGVYNCKGVKVSENTPWPNFAIYWDGDLSRELLDGTKLDKWNGNGWDRMLTIYNYGTASSNNGTKQNPCLTADIWGDWREEMVFRSADNKNILIFTSTYPTEHKIYTLMHDPQYRTNVAWQNNSYNQPPHQGFYLAEDMDSLPIPKIIYPEASNEKSQLNQPWKTIAVGNMAIAGWASANNNNVTVNSSGSGVNSGDDSFQFVYQQVNGDMEIIARLNNFNGIDTLSFAGIMLREDLNSDAKFAMSSFVIGYGAAFQFRKTTGGSTGFVKKEGYSMPVWLRISRSGNDFTGYCSFDGSYWTKMVKTTIDLPANLYVGLAASSYSQKTLCKAEFDNIQITGNKTGNILRETWKNIPGNSIKNFTSNSKFPGFPSRVDYISSLEFPATDWSDEYGTRLRGYLYPSETGDYTFWISGDDSCQLWLSTDTSVTNINLIATVPQATQARQWDKFPEQKSENIYLEAGKKYYIEVLHKEADGDDHLAVAWSGQGIEKEIIRGGYLSPVIIEIPDTNNNDTTAVLEKFNKFSVNIFPNPALNEVNIRISGLLEEVGLDFYSCQGSKLFSETIGPYYIMDLSKYKPGLYIIKISDGFSFNTKQIIKK